MQIAIIGNEFDLVDSNNELATIYGDNECEIVRKTKDNKYIICYGDNSGKVIDTTNHNVILESDDRVYTSTGMSDMTHALEIYKSFFKTCYYQKIDNHLIEISDSKLLDQVEELKKELSVPGVDKELTAKEILLYQCRELPKIDDIYKTITGNIICQDEQVKAILTAIYNNMLISYMNLDRDEMARLKNNILIYGSTGVGKTAIAQEMAKAFHVPFCIEDCNRYTAAGYEGANIDDIAIDLITSALSNNMNIKDAEKGILVLDEIDKLANPTPKGLDVSKTDVQQSLLKFIEGTEINIKSKTGQITKFNTSNLTIIGMGAFAGMQKLADTNVKLNKNPIGFNANFDVKPKEAELTTDSLIKYGLLAELVGRFTQIIKMNDLNEDSLKKIIKYSNKSAIKEQEKFLNNLGIQLMYDETFLNEIAKEAKELGTGARALNNIINHVFNECKFDMFNKLYDNPSVLIMDAETIKNPKKYILK